MRVFVISGVDKIYENRGLSTAQRTVRLSGTSVERTFVVGWSRKRARLPATSEGAIKATTFVAISEGLRVKTPRFEQFRLELGVKLAVCEPIVSTAKRHRGAGFSSAFCVAAHFFGRLVGGGRAMVKGGHFCGRFDEEAGQVVSSVLARSLASLGSGSVERWGNRSYREPRFQAAIADLNLILATA
jgi:hypothetical protein